jgi:hypothetical protein
MSDREILFRWLATVAARVGWTRRLPELGRLACALVALRLLAEVLEVLAVPPSVRSVLVPLLVIAALAVVALFAWRLTRPTTLAQAAWAADTRADLKDEIKSAHWFAQGPARDALVELLLARAARTAQRLDVRRLFPLGLPRSALAALALAVCTGALAWFSPRIALPVIQEPGSTPAVTSGKASEDAAAKDEIDKITAESALPEVAPRQDQSAAWSQLEQLTKQLPAGAEEEAIREAVTARDVRLVSQLVQALGHKQAQQAGARRSKGEQMPAGNAQGILDSLADILKKEAKPAAEPSAGAAEEPTARVTQQARNQAEEERRKMSGTPAEGDIEFNPRMRAVHRNSAVMRDIAYATGEAAEAGAQTSVDGTAMGTPDSKGRAGGTSGEHPESSATDTDTLPVLGEPTVRLQAQLDKVRVEREDDPEQHATKEEFYAATQRRASQVDYESIVAQWRAQREAALASSRTPLSYREAVKRYFLTQHAKEE